MSAAVEITVDAPGWRAVPGAQATIRRAIAAALRDAGPKGAEVGVVLADDAHVRALNRRWRGQDKPTNVLSFPAADGAEGGPRLLGDVVFALETIRREAAAEGKPLEAHLAHLAVHGALHLLGFDHAAEEQAEAMEERERRILARLGVPDPYAEARARERA